jgi:putative redox protein
MMSNNVHVSLVDGMHLEGYTPAGDWTIPMDADANVGGQDKGHRPLTMLQVGLAACMSMDVISILRKKRQEFSVFDAEVQVLQRAEEHPKIYEKLNVHFKVGGPDVAPDAVERAIELSYTKYCPASAMLQQAAEITTSYEIIKIE